MHLTDDQLNEYLDNEIADRAQIELHLSSCSECAARLDALRNLFAEIESLPDLTLSRDFAAAFTRQSNLSYQLPRWLRLTATLQAAIAVITIIFGAPFTMKFISPYLYDMQAPSFAEIFLALRSQWIAWLDRLSQLHIPSIPEIPIIELSSLVIVLTLTGVSVLWIVGNGLLLRNQNKTSR